LSEIEIYTTPLCPYCVAAKRLLAQKGVDFTEINVMFKAKKRQEMQEKAFGSHTVPQIFVDGKHIGDCDKIHELDAAGQLDAMLGLG
jgi:glutaredoxin 3